MSLFGGGGSKTPKPTDAERALAERGAREWNRNVMAFVPVAEQFARDVRTDAGDRASLMRTASHAAAGQAASAAGDRGLFAQSFQAGLSPGAGRNIMGIADASNRYAAGLGTALASAEPGLQERETRGLLKVAAIGRGLADHSQAGLTEVGRRATESAISRSQRKIAESQALTSAISGLAGAGVGAAYFSKTKPQPAYNPQFFPLD